MNAEGTNPTNVTDNLSGRHRFPDWSQGNCPTQWDAEAEHTPSTRRPLRHTILPSVLVAAMLAACSQEAPLTGHSPLPAEALAGKIDCPGGGKPAPGTLVRGGLEVTGQCLLDRVTVGGGIVVDPGGDLEIEASTVSGGIAVAPCGELEIDLADHAIPSGATSTVNGDIVIQASATCTLPAFSDLDIWTARVNGSVVVTGSYFGGPTICGNAITGDVTLDHLTSAHPFWLGDPDGALGCPGNTIGGTLAVRSSSSPRRIEVESNSVAGSVLLNASTLELNENTIGGNLTCSNGTVILPGEDPDPSDNTVHGTSSC